MYDIVYSNATGKFVVRHIGCRTLRELEWARRNEHSFLAARADPSLRADIIMHTVDSYAEACAICRVSNDYGENPYLSR